MSPDVVAHVLAWDEDYVGFPGLQAFSIGDSQSRPIAATWWENIACRQLKALSGSITAVEVTHETGLQDWRRQSLGLLPAGVFVWKDEFEPRHCRRYGPDGETVLTEYGAMPEGEHARRVALNFEPFIPDPEIRRLVMESFEQVPARVMQDLAGRPLIVLPAGTESVDVSDIPTLIGRAMHPHLLAQGRLPPGSHELPADEAGCSRDVQLYKLARQYHSELAVAIRNGTRGLAPGLVVRSKQTRSPFIFDANITDAYAMVDDFKAYVAGTYGMDVCVGDPEPQAATPNEREKADQPAKVREPRMRAQERLILEAIHCLGEDPNRLPLPQPGKAGVKAAVREAIGTGPSGEFAGATAFDRAWERLRHCQDIKDA